MITPHFWGLLSRLGAATSRAVIRMTTTRPARAGRTLLMLGSLSTPHEARGCPLRNESGAAVDRRPQVEPICLPPGESDFGATFFLGPNPRVGNRLEGRRRMAITHRPGRDRRTKPRPFSCGLHATKKTSYLLISLTSQIEKKWIKKTKESTEPISEGGLRRRSGRHGSANRSRGGPPCRCIPRRSRRRYRPPGRFGRPRNRRCGFSGRRSCRGRSVR